MILARFRMVCLFVLVPLAAWLMAACAPTYTPACRGDADNPLERGELAQPSGLTQAGDRIYVASAASLAPPDHLDYCGSFVTAFDADTGEAVGRPFVPRGDPDVLGQETFRFFAGVTYDKGRDRLYIAERETGSVLQVDPSNGRILARAEVGNAPYGLQFMADVTADTGEVRDLLAVADIGAARQAGRVRVLDAESFAIVEELTVEITGRPAVFDYDPVLQRLYVAYYDGIGVAIVDMATGELLRETEAVADELSPTVRGVALDAANERLFFTAEQAAFSGIWAADTETGLLLDHLTLPRRPVDIALGAGFLVALARDRLYIHDASTLALIQTEQLGITTPARLLLDEDRGLVYVTGFEPSVLKLVRLP